MIDEKLIKLQHFLEVDMRIKKEMVNITPPNDYLDELSISKYADKVDDFLLYTFSELKCIAKDIFGIDSVVMNKIAMLETKMKNEFYSCGFNIDKLRLFYKNNISNMEIDFINLVKDYCVGYTFEGLVPVDKATTINELLHFMHSYVLNNEDILQSISAISEKQNDFEYPIVLRGCKVPMFEQLFNSFPNDLDVGCTDMVAINERKLLIMVRDRGHALTIEITIDSNTARLEYFVPKLCNIDMINRLPGVNKVNENSVGATGVFQIPISNLSNELFKFISMVPTDMDMVIKHY